MCSLKKIRLGDVADVRISGVDKKTIPGELPVRLCNYTDVYYNWTIRSAMHDGFMAASAKEDEITKFRLRAGQVVMTKDSETRADIGHTAFVSSDFEDVILGYHCALISPRKGELDGWYLNALFRTQHISDYLARNAGGSGQRYYLSDSAIKDIPLSLPPYDAQLRIAGVLGSIDEKIELNRRKIAELEALAKTIYDYWFVQFDFPDKDGKPYKSSGGKMVWNDQLKREVPEGWKVKPLGEIAAFSNGINYTTKNQCGKRYRIVNVRDISASDLFIHESDLSEITLPSTFSEKYVIPENCILIARSGIPGAIRLIANPKDTLYCGFIIICRPVIADLRPYLTYFMKSLEGSGATHKNSSILNNVSQDMLKRIYVPIPDDRTLLSFKSLMNDLFENITSLQAGIDETTILRDVLLPLLMNGQISVGDLK